MKFQHNVGWYVVIIDDVIVAAGCDLNTMITRQEREKAVNMCMEYMYVRNLSKSLQAEFNSK